MNHEDTKNYEEDDGLDGKKENGPILETIGIIINFITDVITNL